MQVKVDKAIKYTIKFSQSLNRKQEAHQLVVRQNAVPQEFDPKPSEASFLTVFSAVASDQK